MALRKGESITLFFRNKNKQEVVEFSERIIDASNSYLLRKYSKIDRALSIEPQIEHLQFLLNRDIISEDHFETLKNQLLGERANRQLVLHNGSCQKPMGHNKFRTWATRANNQNFTIVKWVKIFSTVAA